MGSRREIIGITGVIGSGKSTVCSILEKKFGFCWIDADKVVHELYRPGQPGYQKIKDYFGTQFVGKKGVHRGRLRRFVLKTPQKLWILNKLIHSLVVHEVNKKFVQYSGGNLRFPPLTLGLATHKRKWLRFAPAISARHSRPLPSVRSGLGTHETQASACNLLICIEATYFDPADLGKFIDRLVIIDAPDEKILKRLAKRKIPRKQLLALLKFQRKNLSRHGILIKNTEDSLVKLEKQIEDCGLFQK